MSRIRPRRKPRLCDWCNQPFEIANMRPWAKFCSFKCKELARTERRRNGTPRLRHYPSKSFSRRETTCPICGNKFIRKRLGVSFCSRKCWIKDCQSRIVPKVCVNCGSKFIPRDLHDQKVRRFCGIECRAKFMRGVNSPAYRDGLGHYRGSDWKEQSEKARERDRGCKALCHDDSWTPRVKEKLSVDHLVAYGLIVKWCPLSNPNELINLISFCRKCHAIKTQGPEAKLYRGDIVGFIQGMSTIVERSIVLAALEHYGLA